MTWKDYLNYDKTQIQGRYAELLHDLSSLHLEAAFHEQQLARIETETVKAEIEQGTSVAAAERQARFYSLEHTLAVIDLRAKRQALLCEQTLLESLM
jgi:hypothetical protein